VFTEECAALDGAVGLVRAGAGAGAGAGGGAVRCGAAAAAAAGDRGSRPAPGARRTRLAPFLYAWHSRDISPCSYFIRIYPQTSVEVSKRKFAFIKKITYLLYCMFSQHLNVLFFVVKV
jgi:hypothetical protein